MDQDGQPSAWVVVDGEMLPLCVWIVHAYYPHSYTREAFFTTIVVVKSTKFESSTQDTDLHNAPHFRMNHVKNTLVRD